ncbi:unannotated protein [freshwater metagenome]|uniref:Unannotated protein n=1 Tax=freshwater metagenome TaxID=449393 RepID=A0A6J7EIH0_9ZZZZ
MPSSSSAPAAHKGLGRDVLTSLSGGQHEEPKDTVKLPRI